MLRSSTAVWHDPDVARLSREDPTTLSHEQLVVLVTELDRRFIQLWDKVTFERERGLVDYAKLK